MFPSLTQPAGLGAPMRCACHQTILVSLVSHSGPRVTVTTVPWRQAADACCVRVSLLADVETVRRQHISLLPGLKMGGQRGAHLSRQAMASSKRIKKGSAFLMAAVQPSITSK